MTDPSLVSIIVITYNSSKYILETLDSIKHQSYKNIELIISDDYSQDDTVDICQEWLKKNEERFARIEIVTNNKNTGIAPNCNRGINAASGEWIKLIAGDDLLIDKCIQINIDASSKTKQPFHFSKFLIESESIKVKNRLENIYEKRYFLFKGNQFDNLINKGYYFPTVTFFANREEFLKIGLYNESYPFHEDLPLWFKILKLGYSFNFIEEYTVKYRVYGNSTYTNNKYIVNTKWHTSTKLFFYQEYIHELRKRRKYFTIWDKIIHYLYLDATIFFGNKKGAVDSICKSITFLSPIQIKNKIKKLSNLFFNN